jgi:hypothetical protein
MGALLCAAAFVAAGCHNNNNDSGYGIGWVTLTDTPGDFTSYIVNVDSVVLTGKTVGAITALSTVETVDFTKLKNFSELWGSASIPNDTYTSATITLDYTAAVITVMVDGKPTLANPIGPGDSPVTTIAVTVKFDPNHPLIVLPTYATTFATRLAIDFNLPASNEVILHANGTAPFVRVKPYLTIATSAADNKPIRIRGPLINSSLGQQTYTVYVRPFYDEVDSLGSVSLFSGPDTIYSINGTAYTGLSGLTALSQLSAGITVTEAFVTLQPTATPSAIAGIFHPIYVVAGSTVEDEYTEGIEGDVIARTGNTLTLRGATLFYNTAEVAYYVIPDSVVLVGPGTIVTRDDAASFSGLDYNSISVGQHITARGIYTGTLPPTGVTTLNATGTQSTNTGSVRIQSTHAWGSVVSTAADSVVLNLQTINDWPASIFNFAGTGATAAQNATAANYVVNTTGIIVPAGTVAGDNLWIDGVVSPFGSAPPDFLASAANDEAGVQIVNTPVVYVPATPVTPPTAGTLTCGNGNLTCVPASLEVTWASGTDGPFTALTLASTTINLTNTALTSAIIRIGPESIDLSSLPASPTIVPVPSPPTGISGQPGAAGLPAVFLPLYSVGNPLTASATTTTVPAATTTQTTAIESFNTFSGFAIRAPQLISDTNRALYFQASGFYDRATNTFNATSINLVL